VESAELYRAIQTGETDRVASLVASDPNLLHTKDNYGYSPVLKAAFSGRWPVVDVLLAHGAPLTIWEAACVGRLDRVTALLDEDRSLVTAYSWDGFHVLHLAGHFGRTEIVQLLLERGADLDAISRPILPFIPANTPLHSTIAGGAWEVARLLINRGARLDLADSNGNTALHQAAFEAPLETVQLLVARGADLSARNKKGQTPLAIAREKGRDEVAAWLGARGAL
jgi:uncharacterized protein